MKISDEQFKEALAFSMASWAEVCDGGSEEEFTEKWRQFHDLRVEARKQADIFLSTLDTAGLRVAASSSSRVERKLREIMTIPQREAYQLPGTGK